MAEVIEGYLWFENGAQREVYGSAPPAVLVEAVGFLRAQLKAAESHEMQRIADKTTR